MRDYGRARSKYTPSGVIAPDDNRTNVARVFYRTCSGRRRIDRVEWREEESEKNPKKSDAEIQIGTCTPRVRPFRVRDRRRRRRTLFTAVAGRTDFADRRKQGRAGGRRKTGYPTTTTTTIFLWNFHGPIRRPDRAPRPALPVFVLATPAHPKLGSLYPTTAAARYIYIYI